jgi:hypothetical protein
MGGINFNTGGGSSFDPANPGAIGGTTPNTGAFTILTVAQSNLGGTMTNGLTLSNSTLATVSQNQSAPVLVLRSQGWKTTATAGSQPAEWGLFSMPDTGGNNPIAQLYLRARLNDGTWNDIVQFTRNAVNPFGQQAFFSGSVTVQSALQVGASISVANGALQSTNTTAFFRSPANATWQLGQDHANTATAQRIQAHGVTTGTGANLTLGGGSGDTKGDVILDGGNRSAYIASPSATEIRDILISHGLMAAS